MSYLLPLVGGGCGVLSVSKRSETDPCTKKGKREKREFSCGSKKRDFSDDDDEVVYIFIREEDGAAITA